MFMCLILLLICVNNCFSRQLDIDIETPNAIIMNAETGAILYEKKAHEVVYPASITKISTALYVLKILPSNLDTLIKCSGEALCTTNERAKKIQNYTLPAYWLETDGSSAKIVKNEMLSIRDLLHGTLLSSGNDASNVLASYVCEDIPTFVNKVNEMVCDLGCKNTHFCNPHGLHHPDHVTSAYDTALIAREALTYQQFKEIVGSVYYKIPHINKKFDREFKNTNALIRKESKHYYEQAFGVKTGYTKLAKYNLVAAASNGERELIVVLHKSPTSKQRYYDAITMFDKAFAEKMETRVLFAKEETSFQNKLPMAANALIAMLKNDVILKYYPSEDENVETKLTWFECKLPIFKGDVVAEISVLNKTGILLFKESLYATNTIKKKIIYQIFDILESLIYICIIPIIFPCIILIILLFFIRDQEWLKIVVDYFLRR